MNAITSEAGRPQLADPPLRSGDRLSRSEFEDRYEAMAPGVQAERIEGVVYMASPVSTEHHGAPHADLVVWLGTYRAFTPGVQVADNATVRLDNDNDPQPDAMLRILPQHGGCTKTIDGYTEGSPEFVAEVAASSASYDLHDKLHAFERNGVQEYLVWRAYDNALDWFVLRDSKYDLLILSPTGFYQSETFPGLWLDAEALLRGDMRRVLEVVQQGVASAEHSQFVQRLKQASS